MVALLQKDLHRFPMVYLSDEYAQKVQYDQKKKAKLTGVTEIDEDKAFGIDNKNTQRK